MMIYALLLCVCLFFIGRTLLVFVGQWKEPILHTFRTYGAEVRTYPLVHLLMWTAAGLVFLALLLYPRRTPTIILLVGIVLAFFAIWVRNYPQTARKLLNKLPLYPLWYRELCERTSRYERRRLAYLWLRLPPHLRALFNRYDKMFLQWSDFVIMGTVLEEDSSREEFQASQLEHRLYKQ
ncbi:MAG: hypothetical protein HXY40_14780 [Chloroflexi bacterium]|nr:hypothetical protein [Chloroflexota bacterium]